MGGIGGGRHGALSSAPTCESAHSIDLAYLRRRGLLAVGHSSSLKWLRGGERTASMNIIAAPDGVRLVYDVTDQDGTRLNVNELEPFAW